MKKPKTEETRLALKLAKEIKKKLKNTEVESESDFFIFSVNLDGDVVSVKPKDTTDPMMTIEAKRIKDCLDRIVFEIKKQQAEITKKYAEKYKKPTKY